MTQLFMDSFDHYSAAQIPRKWSSSGVNVSFVAGAGRHGSACARLANVNSISLYRDLPGDYGTLIVGVAVKFSALPSGTTPFIRMIEGLGIRTHGHLLLLADGRIGVAAGGLTSLVNSIPTVTPGVWYYLEFKYTPHPTSGYAELRMDGVPWWTFTGNTQNVGGGTLTLRRVEMGNNGGSCGNLDLDDLYICNTLGTVNNDFLGDGRIDCLFPSGAGTYAEWTPSGAVPNYSTVDDNPPNDDTDYVSSGVAGQRDSYVCTDLPIPSGAVKAVAIQHTAKKDDVGSRNIQSLVRSAGADYVGANRSLLETYFTQATILEADPATSAPWTVAGVNAAEFGVKLVS